MSLLPSPILKNFNYMRPINPGRYPIFLLIKFPFECHRNHVWGPIFDPSYDHFHKCEQFGQHVVVLVFAFHLSPPRRRRHHRHGRHHCHEQRGHRHRHHRMLGFECEFVEVCSGYGPTNFKNGPTNLKIQQVAKKHYELLKINKFTKCPSSKAGIFKFGFVMQMAATKH